MAYLFRGCSSILVAEEPVTFSPRDLSQGQALTAKPCPWDPLKDGTTDWGQVITNMKLFGIFQIEGFFGGGERQDYYSTP